MIPATRPDSDAAPPIPSPGLPGDAPLAQPVFAAALVDPAAPSPPGGPHAADLSTQEYIATLFVFMLATFVGLDVIRRVSRLLHTPLMSLTNAISAIAVVGSLLIAGRQHENGWINALGLIAIVASVTNIVSGFLITDRMLKMFKRRERRKP